MSLLHVQELLGVESLHSDQSGVWQSVLYWVLWFVFKILYFILFAFLSGNIILILMSPALALLSEQTEKILSGEKYPFKLGNFLKESLRGILLALRNTFIQFGLMILLLVLGFVPFVGLLVPFALLLLSSYFYGFSFLDYYQERRQLSISESVSFMRKHKGLAVGNGLPFALLLLIPIVASIMASFFTIMTTIAGTIAMHEKLN